MPISALDEELDERLQAALQEMDDIMKVSFEDKTSAGETYCVQVKTYAEDLCRFLSLSSNAPLALSKIPLDKSRLLRNWLSTCTNDICIGGLSDKNGMGGAVMEETSGYSSMSSNRSVNSEQAMLEQANDKLKTQLQSLQKQIEQSQSKIRESEARLAADHHKLLKAEERLHKEQVNKAYMESHKLDLMAEVSELRLRLQQVENEKLDFRDRYEGLQNQVLELHEKLIVKDREIGEMRQRLSRNGYHHVNGHHNGHIADKEVESLKRALNELMVASEEKDRKIMELRKAVNTYQKVEEIILQSQSVRPHSSDSESMTSVSRQASTADKPPAATSTPADNETVKRSNSYDAARFHKVVMGTQTPLLNQRKGVKLAHDNEHADTEATSDDEESHAAEKDHKKKKGFKKFFSRSSKLKKSSSQEAIDELMTDGTNFKRGGIRATAGPRLGGGWTRERFVHRDELSEEPRTPFYQWDAEQVSSWLNEIGLPMYASECLKWSKSGKYLLDATQAEVDKELKICNPLHRKKIHLALEAERSGSKRDKLILNLRTDWVSKWLDDIGLPQYKDQFHEARIDGRMLNYITVEDLLYMKITNALHHASIRRGIEVLRKHSFDLSALKRRPNSNSVSECNQSEEKKPADGHLWTNHRVMEWLRSIDLSEYAANLRGSGVHGSLILLEPRFNVENLATILNIPSSKTLLRRHLTAHFVDLVGEDEMNKKGECEQNSLSLGLNSKVKSKRNNLFKKGKSQADYLCPIDLEPIDAKAEDKRIKDAVAQYKKELIKNKQDPTKEKEMVPV